MFGMSRIRQLQPALGDYQLSPLSVSTSPHLAIASQGENSRYCVQSRFTFHPQDDFTFKLAGGHVSRGE
jgi:hypothetical protein